jgi:hypothetical protein
MRLKIHSELGIKIPKDKKARHKLEALARKARRMR